MVQGDTTTAVSAVTPSIPANSNKTRLFDENLNAYADSNGEKKKKVGNYIISKTIGEGSFAKVRLGFHLLTQQKVAVKVINKREVLKRNYLRANLRREACMMQRMQHPNIIQLFEVMETENCYYIVMELIDGIEFVKYLSKKRTLDENETRQYIRQIVSAVDHMHKANVIHRDIKLQNFMLDQNYNLVIIDFGLSNCLDDREFLNTQCGSPAYAAPEIFAHQDYRAEVDIWSIGVNMYAMLAGKLPFKVENRSKNLAKLHACILKGCEIPSYLSPDCQDLLKRLLDPSPNLRIKVHEIISHPWLNYHSFPIEIIPYKPVVDIKEIKLNIVQYLVQKHNYSESEIIDAIVHRKPIALKAMYYLIDKRLKQGLTFPDPEFIAEERDLQVNIINAVKGASNLNNSVIQTNTPITNNHNTNASLTKQNSQLLPKRNGHLLNRTASQKNVDFKFVYNNLNNNTKNNRENDIQNNVSTTGGRSESANTSKSPSPDFTTAINPARNITTSSSTGTNGTQNTVPRSNLRSNYQDIIYRKYNNNNSNNNTPANLNLSNGGNDRGIGTASSNLSRCESRTDRYFIPVTNTHNQPSIAEDHPNIGLNHSKSRPIAGVNGNNVSNGIRSLPGSLYRGSPERSLPRSPDYAANFHQNLNYSNTSNINNNRPPTSRIGSSKPSVISDTSNPEKYYDNQKFKVPNYYVTKRSLTSCDESTFESRHKSSNMLKNRQLQMGKAKIDLGTQQNLNVGITVKTIGAYLKIQNQSNQTEINKPSNTKPTVNLNSIDNITKSKQTVLHHNSNLNNQAVNNTNSINTNRLQGSDSANSLPRIRINS